MDTHNEILQIARTRDLTFLKYNRHRFTYECYVEYNSIIYRVEFEIRTEPDYMDGVWLDKSETFESLCKELYIGYDSDYINIRIYNPNDKDY